jgi:hypothetical protein
MEFVAVDRRGLAPRLFSGSIALANQEVQALLGTDAFGKAGEREHHRGLRMNSEQIRAARQRVTVTGNELAPISGVAVAPIWRYGLMPDVPSGNAHLLDSIEKAPVSLGVKFMGTPEKGPGVRLRRP